MDLDDIPSVLRSVTREWSDPRSLMRLAASDFVHLFSDVRERHRPEGGRATDVLITGIESSLWLGEQFAADLKILFPSINAVALSANKLLGALEEVPRMVHFAGYTRLRSDDLYRDRPLVICISQSGQTFATLHATRLLLRMLGGNVFLLTGARDSKMRDAVIDALGPEAGERRVLHNLSGVRPCEPSTVAAAAMHHTLTEFLIYVGQCACMVADSEVSSPRRGGRRQGGGGEGKGKGRGRKGSRAFDSEMAIGKEDLIDFRDLVDSLHDDLPEMINREGRLNQRLRAKGQQWARHVTEPWRVMVLSGAYILVTVISGYPIFGFLFGCATGFSADSPGLVGVQYALRVLDALFYIFLPKTFSYLLRYLEGRTILARHGKRTLVICDVPYVYKNLENYVSKLFALSYSFINLEVHGTSAHDEMVHRFTHRVSRGVLMLLGRPDGRILSMLKTEQTIMLGEEQKTRSETS